ncbi:branched-chain amino acid ABC transporter permease [Falsiroseomonas bella]|uniref:Branched-chain amino acid ABC transporter permease n=1 Tax=Falsiroseomonas bella TaxID=2184016 RepID=A0A317FFB4_9PROT|nr:branched-chain amino acid ABC transporter permease [Falsiroseomonas bella]PWS37233.1 branched-chain amino acid ABC transporter permease [Falsiroseomonas bella]
MSRMAVLAFCLAVPALVWGIAQGGLPPYLLHILALACTYAIPAIGLNIMLGYAGLVCLGHAAFVGLGAYTLGILAVDHGWSFWGALPLAAVVAGVAGGALGAVTLRLRTHFFMIATLAFGLVLHAVMNNWEELTRGPVGLPGIPRPEGFTLLGLDFAFRRLPDFAAFAVGATAVAFAISALLIRSDFGRMLVAIRQDETLAAAKGVNVTAGKVLAFAIGAAIAGAGGAVKAAFLRVSAPASFEYLEGINLVLIVIIGGAGRLSGPLLGALLFVALPEYLRVAAEWRLVFFGVALVMLMRFAPEGLAGILARVFRRRAAAA